MRYLISTLLIMAATAMPVIAQSTLFQESITLAAEINGDNRSDDDLLDIVFSKGGDRLLTYKLDIASKVVRSGGRLIISIDNTGIKTDGELKYKGFSIDKILIPKVFSAEFVLLDESGNELKRWSVENEHFEAGHNMVHYNYDDSDVHSCKLRIVSVTLHFNKSGVRAADEYVSLIDSYFDTDAHLRLIDQQLSMMRIDTIEMLDVYRQQTIDNVAVFNNIKSAQYAAKLDLENYDPIDLTAHVSRTEQQNRDIKKKLDYMLGHMHEAYYAKGMDWLNWERPDKAEQMFVNSISTKHNYAPPHYQLALSDFDEAHYITALDSCTRIIADMNPDSDIRYNTIKLSERIIYIYIDSIRTFIASQQTDAGFATLSMCKGYCKRIKGIRNFEEFDQLSAQLYGTIHKKMIARAQAAYDAGNYNRSLQSVDSAAALRMEYPDFAIDPTAENLLLNNLYKSWIAYGKSVSAEQPDEALAAFDNATYICRKYTAVECTSELENLAFSSRTHRYVQMLSEVQPVIEEAYADSALALLNDAETYQVKWGLTRLTYIDDLRLSAYQTKYNDLMAAGDEAMTAANPREAIAFYGEALKINKSQAIEADTAWTTKNRNATIKYVVQLCSLGISYADLLQMGKAGQQYQKALDVANDGMVTKEKTVQTALSELSAALSNGECSKAWFDYNVQLGSAERLIKQKEFIKARTSLVKAAGIARANYKCNLTDSVVEKRSNDIEAICRYQQLVNSVQPLLEQKEFRKALDTYVAATEFFADSCNNKFGIKHKPVYDYVLENKYTGLINCAVIYYADINELQKSLKLLNELYRRYFEAMWAKESQAALGIELARRDYRLHPKSDPKVKVLDYTHGDKWYNNLKRSYLQEWIDNSIDDQKSAEN